MDSDVKLTDDDEPSDKSNGLEIDGELKEEFLKSFASDPLRVLNPRVTVIDSMNPIQGVL